MSANRLLVPLGFAVAMSLFGDLTLYAVLPTQLEVVGLSLAAVGVMLGINRLVRIPGNPFAGVLLDRFGRRRLFVLGMTLGVISTAGYALARGFWPFLATRVLWGIAWTLINVGGMTMVLDISTPTSRGRLVGSYNTWVLAGLAGGSLFGGFLVDVLGFQTAMLVNAGLTGLGWLVAVLALPETLPGERRSARSAKFARGGGWRRARERLQSLWHKQRWLLGISLLFMLAMFAGDGIVFSTISLLLQRQFGDSMPLAGLQVAIGTSAGLLLGVRSFVAGAAGPLAGHWSDVRFGRWPVLMAGLLLGVIGFSVLSFAFSPLQILTGVVLSALSSGITLAMLGALLGDFSPAGRQGSAMGLFASMGDVGSASGPFLAYALISFIDLRWVYLLSATLFVMAIAAILRLRRSLLR